MIPSLVRLSHCDCTRKQDVILQVNVLVKIGFKVRQRLVEGLVLSRRRPAWLGPLAVRDDSSRGPSKPSLEEKKGEPIPHV